jgi:biopolymer transport protein ExbD
MAELQTGGGDGGNKKRAKKQSTRVDMTPLVDLAFLLLTFFVLTSTFSKPKVLRMIFPEKLDKNDPLIKQPEVKNGLTLLLTDDNRIFYYTGGLKATTVLEETNYTKNGLRKILAERNLPLINELKKLQDEQAKINEKDTAAKRKFEAKVKDAQVQSTLVLLVKHDKNATYENMIDVLDEFLITQIAKYFVVYEDMTELEKKLIQAKINL